MIPTAVGEVIKKDIVVIGAGIVGLATAYELLRLLPGYTTVVLDKEPRLAGHQTGHNSGVLHSGIYYKPGSLKAQFCREGKSAMERFCEKEDIPFERCGKVVVALDNAERERLHDVADRARKNGVKCELVGPERLRELEPHAAGIEALHVPGTGIVGFVTVCERLAGKVYDLGGEFIGNSKVVMMEQVENRVRIETEQTCYEAKVVINCAGLYSDVLARVSGAKVGARIIPFRGEYFELIPEAENLVKNLIYPVPNPAFPFLGVHFTRMIHGGVECGPNAVLAFSREGYSKWQVRVSELVGSLTYPGFLKLAASYWETGAEEMWRSLSKEAFVDALKRLLPAIKSNHLKAAPAGVRAQAVSQDGKMIDDFLIVPHQRVVNVCNAPSPAATSSLKIAERIGQYALEVLK